MSSLVRAFSRLLLRVSLQLALAAVMVAGVYAGYRHLFVGQDSAFARALTSALPVTIERAVDGDTLAATVNGRPRRIRLLGIDTPESVKPNAPVDRCGREASARAKAWVKKHRQVKLVKDPAAPDEDQYGRLLRYVEPTDGSRDLSTVQAAAGLARVKSYGQDLKRLPELRRAQSRARQADRGLWGTGCAAR